MPRGKYVNHKGRARLFTSPEELRKQTFEDLDAEELDAMSDQENADIRTSQNSYESDDDQLTDEDEKPCGTNKGLAGLIEIENPNRRIKTSKRKLTLLTLDDNNKDAVIKKPELSRRQREELKKQKSLQLHEKLHAAGLTSEAKADLARLTLIRQQREEAAAKRLAEKQAKRASASRTD